MFSESEMLLDFSIETYFPAAHCFVQIGEPAGDVLLEIFKTKKFDPPGLHFWVLMEIFGHETTKAKLAEILKQTEGKAHRAYLQFLIDYITNPPPAIFHD